MTWTIDRVEEGSTLIAGAFYTVIADQDGEVVALIPRAHAGAVDEKSDARAVVIAAAPELLEALRAIVKDGDCPLLSLVEQAEAAIAKAEGRDGRRMVKRTS